MHIPESPASVEYVDPHRDRLGTPEIFDCQHPDFSAEDVNRDLGHHGHAVAAWNRAFRGGQARSADGVPWLSRLIDAKILWRNPNLVLVPNVDGYSELHALMASVLPDEVLQKQRIPRPDANFCLWPFSPSWPAATRADLARRAAAAFSEFVWESSIPQRIRRSTLRRDSSLRVLFDDSRRWQAALYRAAMERAEELASSNEPIDFTLDAMRACLALGEPSLGIPPATLEGNRAVFRNSQGHEVTMHLPTPRPGDMFRVVPCDEDGTTSAFPVLAYPHLNGSQLWNFQDPNQREDALRRMYRHVGELDSIVGLLSGEILPEEIGDDSSWVARDVKRRVHRWRAKGGHEVTVRVLKDSQVYADGRGVVEDGGFLLRDFMTLLHPTERRVVVLALMGHTQNEIAADVDRSRATIARMLKRIEPRMVRALRGG